MRATRAPNMVSVLQEGPGLATCSNCHMSTWMGNIQDGHSRRDKEWIPGCQGLGREGVGSLIMGMDFLWGDGMFQNR